MAFEKRTAIVSLAALVMIVAMTVSEVEARLSVGRDLMEATSERRYLADIVDKVVGKHCCNKVITRCCNAPPPTTSPSPTTRKLTATTEATSGKSTTAATSGKSTTAKAPKSAPSKSMSTSPKSKAASPNSKSASPKSKSASPKSKAASPKSTSDSPKSKSASPKSKAALAPKAMGNNNKKTTVQRN